MTIDMHFGIDEYGALKRHPKQKEAKEIMYLTELQAYKAMYHFLSDYYQKRSLMM